MHAQCWAVLTRDEAFMAAGIGGIAIYSRDALVAECKQPPGLDSSYLQTNKLCGLN